MGGKPVVLAIDPGRDKCGVAVVTPAAPDADRFEIDYRGVVAVDELPALLARLVERFRPAVVVVGNGTNSAQITRFAEGATGVSVVIVDERFSTIAARKRFFEENPPRGWRKLIPLSLQTPGRPYDDYVAVILAEEYLRSHGELPTC
jgi:RNase H-fold protein (predicted Holliday junction resolvase)